MHIAGGGELASEGAAEGVRGVKDGAAPASRTALPRRVAGKVGLASKVCAHKSLGCMQFIASAESLSQCLIPGKAVTCLGCDVRPFKPTLEQGKNNCVVCVPRNWCYYCNYCS